MKVKLKSRKSLLVIVILIFVSLILIINNYNTPENRLKRQLELGHKYLIEQNYDEAIVAFCKVIEFDPSIKEAYFKLSEIYIHNKDYEQAKAILEEGYKIINNDEFIIRLNELEELIVKEDIEKFKIDNIQLAEQIIDEYKLENYNKTCELAELIFENLYQTKLNLLNQPIIIYTDKGNIGIYNYKDYIYNYLLYCGDYENDIRNGKGIIISSSSSNNYAIGEWKNDKPNGIQKVFSIKKQAKTGEDILEEKIGYVIDGIWDGKVEIKKYLGASNDYNYYVYIVNLRNGKIDILSDSDSGYGNMCKIGKGARYDKNGKFLWDAFLDMKIQYKNGIYGMWSFGYGDSNPF